eukprot:2642620-Rhodomonas_salina.2
MAEKKFNRRKCNKCKGDTSHTRQRKEELETYKGPGNAGTRKGPCGATFAKGWLGNCAGGSWLFCGGSAHDAHSGSGIRERGIRTLVCAVLFRSPASSRASGEPGGRGLCEGGDLLRGPTETEIRANWISRKREVALPDKRLQE